MLYFYQVFLECEIVSKAKHCSWMGKRQRVYFYSCFLFIAPQKYFLFISGYTYFGMFFSESSFKTPAISSFIPCFFIYKFQSADQSSYKEKYFTLLSAMKQIQNTFLRAQQNAEKNVKGIYSIISSLFYICVWCLFLSVLNFILEYVHLTVLKTILDGCPP